jgi:hypothetical protein
MLVFLSSLAAILALTGLAWRDAGASFGGRLFGPPGWQADGAGETSETIRARWQAGRAGEI